MKKFKRAVSALLALAMLLSSLALTLTSCGDMGEGDGGSSQGGGSGAGGNNGGAQISSCDISVKTIGGMVFADLPVHLYTMADGSPDELIDYGATDSEGKISFNLDKNETYAVKIDSAIPKGYNVNTHYPIVGSKLDIVVSSSLITDESVAGKSLSLGDIMYDFTVPKPDGTTVKLSEELKTHDMVLLNFWFDGCFACEQEFPYMQYAYEQYEDKVSIIAVSPKDDLSNISNYQQFFGLTFDMGKDEGSVLTEAFGVEGFPTSVVIDRYGVITLIEVGALPSERAFRIVFDYFSGDNYKQSVVSSVASITPREKPDVEMPASDEISAALDGGVLNATYSNDEDDEYSWPFVIEEKDGETYIKASNSGKEESYAQLIANIELEEGDVLAFDYKSFTERGADILYVIVDGKDIYSISGEGSDWSTCYSYVAEEQGTYEVAFVYMKDGSTNADVDTVYIKNLRTVEIEDIDTPSYIYRFAATKPNSAGEYQSYASIVLGSDGYYHVDSADGPLLLADLMGYTRFAPDKTVYDMSVNKSYENGLVKYCSYASNSQLYGLCPVTEELKGWLEQLAESDYAGEHDANTWLQLCCYYNAYGTDGVQLADPIKGLSTFSAYETVLSEKGSTQFPNSVTYDRVIMPRGLFFAFTPEQDGVYLVTSRSDYEVNAWIFRESDINERTAWITYDNVDRRNAMQETPDLNNCYMIAYFEAGTTYYIDIAFYDVYQYGTIDFRVERLGDAGRDYRFSVASPGYFTYYETSEGAALNKIIAGGVEVELGNDGFYREKGEGGSILYADFTLPTLIFNKSIQDMIDERAFDFRYTEEDLYILKYIEQKGSVEACDAFLREQWGAYYEQYAENYMLEEIYEIYEEHGVNARYHGTGDDMTEEITAYLSKIIKAGDNEIVGNVAADDARIGCVVVDEELAEILQLLMDKYTFPGVEDSWRKLCYYHEYFGPEATE